MTQEFDLDAFIAGINQDKTQSTSTKDKLNKVVMNTKDHQGVLTMIPIMSRTLRNFYLKIARVYEYWGDTSLIDAGEAWYRILPLQMYGELSPEQIELYHEVKSQLDYLNDNEEVSFNEFRVRNYSLFFGICQQLKSTEGKVDDKLTDAPCLFTYPSNSVIDALGTAINTKIEAMKGKREWIPMVLSPANTGRQGVMMISFAKSASPGYDCTISFEFNSAMNIVVDDQMVIDDKIIEMYDDVLPQFLGWIYDRQNKSYFNETAFRELNDQLKLRIKSLGKDKTQVPADANKTYENKNDLNQQALASLDQDLIKKTPF